MASTPAPTTDPDPLMTKARSLCQDGSCGHPDEMYELLKKEAQEPKTPSTPVGGLTLIRRP